MSRALLILLLLLPTITGGAPGAQPRTAGVLLEMTGPLGPAVADYVVRGIERAEADAAPLVILRIDTPGGLDASMRVIIQRMLAAHVPIIAWVAPRGARAASAGTFILYAAHVAAMSPATNLGAATPVSIAPGSAAPGAPASPDSSPGDAARSPGREGDAPAPGGAHERKAVNDAVAYIRGLAELRGRNADWAEAAVREAASLSAEAALRDGVVELVVEDLAGLLDALDGREVEILGEQRVLATAGIEVISVAPDWRSTLLALLTNPNVAYVLMLLGIYGLFFELANPGSVVPGVIGVIALLLALYAFQVLPVNYAGLALLLVGVAFMVGEVFVPSFGALGIGGVAAFVAGSLMLFDSDLEHFRLSLPLVAALALASVAFVMLVAGLALRQRRHRVVSGVEWMIGQLADAAEGFSREGSVELLGERWNARSPRPVARGQKVRITRVDGLTLEVEPDTED